jgi:hypothetical protein
MESLLDMITQKYINDQGVLCLDVRKSESGAKFSYSLEPKRECYAHIRLYWHYRLKGTKNESVQG